jgi:immunity protein 5 of polymorphic toxin system
LTCSSRLGPEEPRSRHAIEQARAWVRGEITMSQARTAVGHANAAARDLSGAARHATHAAGQAAAVAHAATHELGAAAYGLKAAHAAAPEGVGDSAGRLECLWQRDQLPEAIRELVLANDICWSTFDRRERRQGASTAQQAPYADRGHEISRRQ